MPWRAARRCRPVEAVPAGPPHAVKALAVDPLVPLRLARYWFSATLTPPPPPLAAAAAGRQGFPGVGKPIQTLREFEFKSSRTGRQGLPGVGGSGGERRDAGEA